MQIETGRESTLLLRELQKIFTWSPQSASMSAPVDPTNSELEAMFEVDSSQKYWVVLRENKIQMVEERDEDQMSESESMSLSEDAPSSVVSSIDLETIRERFAIDDSVDLSLEQEKKVELYRWLGDLQKSIAGSLLSRGAVGRRSSDPPVPVGQRPMFVNRQWSLSDHRHSRSTSSSMTQSPEKSPSLTRRLSHGVAADSGRRRKMEDFCVAVDNSSMSSIRNDLSRTNSGLSLRRSSDTSLTSPMSPRSPLSSTCEHLSDDEVDPVAPPGSNFLTLPKHGDTMVSMQRDETTSDGHFYAIYDGHAGTAAAEYASNNLHKHLLASESFDSDLSKAFVEAFDITDREFIKQSLKENDISGTTATCVLVRGNTMTVANAGDGRAVLSRKKQAVNLSRDHRPDQADEKERIEKHGGWVESAEVLNVPKMFRLGLEDDEDDDKVESIVGWTTVHRVNGVLGVTRSIGDVLIKDEEKILETFGKKFSGNLVINTPEIKVENIEDGDEFFILGSDGLWDVVTSDEAVKFMHDRLEKAAEGEGANLSRQTVLTNAAEELVEMAIDNGSIDNVSVLVVDILGGDLELH